MKTVRKSAHGGARPGAGRPKGSRTRKPIELSGTADPARVLELIAADPAQPAAARVAACKALLAHRRLPAESAEPAKQQPAAKIVWLKREA